MQAEGLRGLPDTLRVNRHLAAACPDLASSLAKIGVNLRITDSANAKIQLKRKKGIASDALSGSALTVQQPAQALPQTNQPPDHSRPR